MTYHGDITIIYPPTADWYFLRQRPQQLLRAFSAFPNVRSIFISSEAFQPLKNPIMAISEQLFVVRKDTHFDHLLRGKKVLWFSFPTHFLYANRFRCDFVVFDAIDNPIEEFSHWKNDLSHAVKRADLITCVSPMLYETHLKSGKPVLMCPNGADFPHFYQASQPLSRPHDYPAFSEPRKVIGFYGAMASWVDFDLIEKIAQFYNVVIIGNNRFFSKEFNHPNIVTLSHKPYEELPFYLSQFDAAIVPFKLTEMVKGCDPIKFYEFLSSGKPVFATRIDSLLSYEGICAFIDHQNFVKTISRAFREDNIAKKEERIRIAKQNDWHSRAESVLKRIREHLGNKG